MKLLPREEKFYVLFHQHLELIEKAAKLLVDGVNTGNAHLANNTAQMKLLEEEADKITHETFTRLNRTFITPLDPEDIQSLSANLDDVIDGIEDAAHRMVSYRVEPIPSVVREVCGAILNCVKELQKAFQALEHGGPLVEPCLEVHRLEDAAEQLIRDAMAKLFETEKDPLTVMKLKEIYDHLSYATGACENVSDILQMVAVKNS